MKTIPKEISQEEKINLIFSYLFSDKKNLEEEDFWNKLSDEKLDQIKRINEEETYDFSLLKSKIIGK